MPQLTGFQSVAIPGPKAIPLLGHLPRVIQFFEDPVGALTSLRKYGDIVAVTRDSPSLVCVFGPERNREVLGNPAGFRHDEDFIQAQPGTPLSRIRRVIVCMNGDEAKRHRRLMAPAFSRSTLESYADEMVRVSEAVVARWPRDQVVDVDALLRDLALSVAVRALFGIDIVGGATEMGEVAGEFGIALTQPLAILLPYDLPGTPFRRAQRLAARLLGQLELVIEQKRRGVEVEHDALALLLRANADDEAGFDDDELIAETVTLLFAGHETMAKTLSWTMFLLDRHPAVLADVLDELDGVLGGRPVSAADLPNLPLLERVMKESMRVLTPVPTLFLRVPATDTALGRHTLPKGANVVVSPYATHHDPELYPQPRRFMPERWEGLKPTPFEYMPFGAGARICIGAAFAQQAVRLMLATVLQRTRIAVVRDAKISRLTRANIMMPRFGIQAHIQAPHRKRLKVEPIRGDIGELVELR